MYCHRGLFPARLGVVNGVRLVYVPGSHRKSLSQLSHSLAATLHLVLHERPDVALYVNSANGPLGWLLKGGGIRSAINVDGLEWLRPKWKGFGAKYFRWSSAVATTAFDVVVTDAEAMADIYRQQFNAPSTVIEYGANVGYSERPERVREAGVTPGDYYLVVARLVPDNNAELIVQGFTQSKARRKLLVVGDVPYADPYADRVRATADPRLVFPGYVRDQQLLRELYCNSYVYLHGHEFGGTNPTLLKALAYGCAIGALDTPFSREVLNGDRHGLYFSKDPASVTACIDRLEHDQGHVGELRSRSRDRIAERYTWERIVDEYERLISKLRPNS